MRDDVRVTTKHQSADGAAAPPSEVRRIGLVVHPRREIGTALENVRAWTEANGTGLYQIRVGDQQRVVADAGEIADCDLVLALGGDGTHEGRDGIAWSSWDEPGEGRSPQEVPLPDDLPAS